MSDEISVDRVRQALTALYFHPDPNLKKQADTWLQHFQRQPIAWSISKILLESSPELEVQFFGATTLCSKIRYDLDSLSKAEIEVIKESIILLIDSKYSGLNAVFSKLCLAISAIMIRTADGTSLSIFFETMIRKIQTSFGQTMNYNSIFMTLEILGYLCEELESAILSYNKREELKKTMLKYAESTVELVKYLLFTSFHSTNHSQSLNLTIILKSLQCLLKWLKFGVAIPYQSLLKTQMNIELQIKIPPISLMDILFTNINSSQEIFGIIIDIITELLQKPTTFTSTKSILDNRLTFEQDHESRLIKEMIIRVLSLRQTYDLAKKEGKSDIIRGITHLLVSLCEGHINIIVDSINNNLSEGWKVIEFMIECTSSNEIKSVELCLDFWSLLEGNLDQTPNKEKFVPVFKRLLEILVVQLRYPVTYISSWDDVESELDSDDFTSFRDNSQSTLLSIFYVLDFITFISIQFEALKVVKTWQDFESILYSLRSVSKSVMDSMKTNLQYNNYLLQLFQSIIQYGSSSTMNNVKNSLLQQSISLLLGEFSEWIDKQESLLGQSLQLLISYFNSNQSDLIFCASKGLLLICKQSGKTIVNVMSTLLLATDKLLSANSNSTIVLIDDKIRVIESIHWVSIYLPYDQFLSILSKLSHPVIQRLTNLLQSFSQPSINLNDLIKSIIHELKLVHSIIKLPNNSSMSQVSYISDPFWVILQLMFSKYANEILGFVISGNIENSIHENLLESMSELCTEMIKADKFKNVSKVTELLEFLMKLYGSTSSNSNLINGKVVTVVLPPLLQMICTIIQVSNTNQSNKIEISTLNNIIKVISDNTFLLIQHGVNDYVILLEKYFQLTNNLVTYSYEVLTSNSNVFYSIFQLGTACLIIQERDTIKAVLLYLENLITIGTTKYPHHLTLLQNVLSEHGYRLISSYFKAITSTTHCRPLIQSDLLYILAIAQPQVMLKWIQSCLIEDSSAGLATNIPGEDKMKFLKALSVIISKQDKRRFKSLMNDFSQVCNSQQTSDVFLSYELQ